MKKHPELACSRWLLPKHGARSHDVIVVVIALVAHTVKDHFVYSSRRRSGGFITKAYGRWCWFWQLSSYSVCSPSWRGGREVKADSGVSHMARCLSHRFTGNFINWQRKSKMNAIFWMSDFHREPLHYGPGEVGTPESMGLFFFCRVCHTWTPLSCAVGCMTILYWIKKSILGT